MTDTTGRNIVILRDGTGNEISENISNVPKLYRCLIICMDGRDIYEARSPYLFQSIG